MFNRSKIVAISLFMFLISNCYSQVIDEELKLRFDFISCCALNKMKENFVVKKIIYTENGTYTALYFQALYDSSNNIIEFRRNFTGSLHKKIVMENREGGGKIITESDSNFDAALPMEFKIKFKKVTYLKSGLKKIERIKLQNGIVYKWKYFYNSNSQKLKIVNFYIKNKLRETYKIEWG